MKHRFGRLAFAKRRVSAVDERGQQQRCTCWVSPAGFELR
jgi:hypothetical protein